MKQVLQVLRFVLLDVVRNRWVIAYAIFFLAVTEVLLRLGGTAPRALLGLLDIVLLLIPLVTLVFGTIYWHGAREFNELLLAQPVDRTTLFHGLFAGLVVPLSAAFVVGLTVPMVAHGVLQRGTLSLFGLMLVAGVALTAVFGALAVLIAGLVDDRLKGLGIALGVWVGLTIAYDGLVLWAAMAFQQYPLEGPMLALTFANPVDLARVLLVLRFDVSALMGYTGAVFREWLGGTAGMAMAATGLALWTLVPGLLALRAFRRRDF
jgi:Cu-processing system permease protein